MSKKVNIYEEASRCLLCKDAPCTKACKTGDPARAIRVGCHLCRLVCPTGAIGTTKRITKKMRID